MKKISLLFILLASFQFASAKWVKFRVDMSAVLIDSNGVYIAGDFQDEIGVPADWTPGVTEMTQEGSSSVYSVKVNIPAFTKYEYKFFNGMFGYNVEFVPIESRVDFIVNDNRWIYIDSLSSDTTEFPAIAYSGNAPAGQFLMRFYVDMQNESSVSGNGVHVAGDWQGFDASQLRMYSFDGNVYQYIAYIDSVSAPSGTEYKFANGNTSGDFETVPGPCENGFTNRELTLTTHTLVDTVCYSSCGLCAPAAIARPRTDFVSVYPNPATEFIVVTTGEIMNGSLQLFNAAGAMVDETSAAAQTEIRLERNGLPAGLYLLKGETAQGNLLSTRVIFR